MDDIPLADFVSQSLVSIAEGVEKANEEFVRKQIRAKACPFDQDTAGGNVKRGETVELVEFDIAVKAFRSKQNKTNVGVTFAVVGGGTLADSAARQHQESRLRFKVPLKLPNWTGEPPANA